MPTLQTVRSTDEQQKIDALVTLASDQVRELQRHPWSNKALGVALLKELAKTPGAYWRLVGAMQAMTIFLNYKRPHRKGPVPRCPLPPDVKVTVVSAPSVHIDR